MRGEERRRERGIEREGERESEREGGTEREREREGGNEGEREGGRERQDKGRWHSALCCKDILAGIIQECVRRFKIRLWSCDQPKTKNKK